MDIMNVIKADAEAVIEAVEHLITGAKAEGAAVETDANAVLAEVHVDFTADVAKVETAAMDAEKAI